MTTTQLLADARHRAAEPTWLPDAERRGDRIDLYKEPEMLLSPSMHTDIICYGTRGSVSEKLHKLAAWLEEHEVTEAELVTAEASWHDIKIHLYECGARRIFAGRKVGIDDDGHCYFREDGILFSFIENGRPTTRRETTL